MQTDCYKRNFKSSVCSIKCPFKWECERAYAKELKNKILRSENEGGNYNNNNMHSNGI